MNKIFCLGLGKLGLIFSHILAKYNYKILGYDIDQNIENKILKNIKDPEPLLNKLINENRKNFFF